MAKPRDQIVADAIIAELNAEREAGTFSQAFVAERDYTAGMDKADTRTLLLQVQANGYTDEWMTRRHRKLTHSINVMFRKNLGQNKAAIDALSAFVEEVRDYYATPRGRHKIANTEATVVGVLLVPVNPDEIDTNQQFFSGVTLSVVEVVT